MLMELARIEIVEYGKKMVSGGLTQGTAGNLSIFDPELGLMAISPSGVPYEDTRPEDVVVMRTGGEIVDGNARPSSEYLLHFAIYEKRSDARAIVHAHSMFCTTLACMRMPLKSIHYAIAGAGAPEIPLVPYHTFGTKELADAVRESVDPSARGLLLANHGMLAFHESMKSAFGLALTMEWCAEVQWRCLCAGTPNYLTKEQMKGAMKRYESYGQISEDGTHPHGYM